MGQYLLPQTHEAPDSLHPEEAFRQFATFIRNAPARLSALQESAQHYQDAMQDLLHYIELAGNQNAARGYALYKKLVEIRRERRACKEEIELLTPAVEFINSLGDLNQFVGRLGTAQGKCHRAKELITERAYRIRTTELDEFMEEGETHH